MDNTTVAIVYSASACVLVAFFLIAIANLFVVYFTYKLAHMPSEKRRDYLIVFGLLVSLLLGSWMLGEIASW